MVDTVSLFTSDFSLKESNKFQRSTITDYSTGEVKSEKVFCNDTSFNLTIKDAEKSQLLFLQTSLPKLLYKSNYFEVNENDRDSALTAIYSGLNQAGVNVGSDQLDDWSLSRVDFCRNLKVDHAIIDYLLTLNQFCFTRRDKIEIKKETINFRNKSQDFTFYNKIKEILDTEKDAAIIQLVAGKKQDILRVESRLKKKAVIDRQVHHDMKFAELFDVKLAKRKLLNDLEKLTRIDKNKLIECNTTENINLLRFIETRRKRNSFSEFLAVKGVANFLIEFQHDWQKILDFLLQFGYPKTTAYRHIKTLKDYQSLLMLSEKRNLIEEIKYKIAA